MAQLSWIKQKVVVSLLAVLLVISSLTIMVAPASADAKKSTVVTVQSQINHADEYGSVFRCVTGDYKPLLNDPDSCEILQGQIMNIKPFTKGLTGLPEKEMIYEVRSNNSTKSYICVKKGAIERGYADTVSEIVLSEKEKIEDVCATVNGVGDNKTKALFTVKEKEDGLYIVFQNTGKGDWKGYIDDFPYTTGEVKVDFDKIP
ncbi:MAG: hypothetical protein F6K16_02855 [Symploca sp. SIO2B6]|nr:hypothetical protein [Symploca sp. SIO2B6]